MALYRALAMLFFWAFSILCIFDWFFIRDLDVYFRLMSKLVVVFIFGYLLLRYYLRVNILMINKYFLLKSNEI